MKRIGRHRPSPAMAVALIALLLAVVGPANAIEPVTTAAKKVKSQAC